MDSPSKSYGGFLQASRSTDSFHSLPIQTLTSEGWLELFLTPSEKRAFSQWKEEVVNKSLSHKYSAPLMNYLSKFIPDHIAPNIITLTGFACLGQAWYIINQYGETFPKSCTWFALVNILIFYCTHSMDVLHSEKIRQSTPLGTLFKYCCDCNATVFLVIVTTYCLGGDALLSWYAVQSAQLVLFTKHLSAFHRKAGLRYNVLTGPGEVIISVIILLAVRGTLGLDWFMNLYKLSVHQLIKGLDLHAGVSIDSDHLLQDPAELSSEAMMTFYYIMYATAVVKTLKLQKTHGWTRFGLAASLLMRFLPAVILRVGTSSGSSFELTVLDVICDGFFMAVLTTDVTLAKMARREIHPWVVLMSFCAVVSNSTILFLVLVYYIAVFADLCSYLNMPLMTVCKNVYCDGVYDLCHIGHKTLFRNALRYGNRLYVGVVGDKDASSYKRPPIMTHDERCAEVEACKSVTKVLPNSPCFGLTKEFLDTHQIHVVAYGEEYLERWPNPDDDIYYGYARKIGIARPLPRHDGLSTSDLIRRIQNAKSADDRNDK
uniref:ethanolamine-phosphate cytidylyltransferase n=1 Tax=Chaetoceros debilis TaxID=122233 RepID=A0A7S3Q196_9STRA|mmetsp:Transcript_25264/g.37385  ORF Transcript_25264/g.37385 Transcript_25264/m.37385 type:complete len:544 (-) Transcript_25264:80-1711(-)